MRAYLPITAISLNLSVEAEKTPYYRLYNLVGKAEQTEFTSYWDTSVAAAVSGRVDRARQAG